MTIEEIESFINTKKSELYETITPWVVGSNYLIRTVTMIYTGKLTKVYTNELVIIDAAWIAETERWTDSVKNGNFKEIEPYPDNTPVIIGRGSINDAVIVTWKLPRIQK